MEQPSMGHMYHDAIKPRASGLTGKFTAKLKHLFHILLVHAFYMSALIFRICGSFQFQILGHHTATTMNQLRKSFAVIRMHRTLQ